MHSALAKLNRNRVAGPDVIAIEMMAALDDSNIHKITDIINEI